jgi:hypothetical protein
MPTGKSHSFSIFHFAPLTHFRGAGLMVRSLLDGGVRPVLDLEDSVQCVFDAQRSRELKKTARSGLLQLAVVLGQKLNQREMSRILVRINGRHTEHYAADIRALASCYSLGFKPGIVLPKVETPEDLSKCAADLQSACGMHPSVNPILETGCAMKAVPEILAHQAAAWDGEPGGVTFFGYFDYALDIGQWPLLSPFQHEFWNLTLPVREAVENAGLLYVHPPLQEIGTTHGLQRIKAMLLNTGSRPAGMASLGMQQTEALRQHVEPTMMAFDVPRLAFHDAAERARWVVQQFESARCSRRSFAVADGYFISPHEYLLARNHLQLTTESP